MTLATGLPEASGMLVLRTAHTATRDDADRIANEYVAEPHVELVHVWRDHSGWIVDVYSDVRGDAPSGVVVARAYVERLLARLSSV